MHQYRRRIDVNYLTGDKKRSNFNYVKSIDSFLLGTGFLRGGLENSDSGGKIFPAVASR